MAWRLINYNVCNIFENMATDEAIFQETINKKNPPTIRFYGTDPAAITAGYFQNLREEIAVEKCKKEKIDIARRITGGKAVFHHKEITYCLTASENEEIFPKNIAGTYKMISECIAYGLNRMKIRAILAEGVRISTTEKQTSCCFSTPSKSELLINGRKICGSAQLRKKGGFLQHGSLLISFDAEKISSLLLPERTPEQITGLKNSITALDQELSRLPDIREICENLKKGFIQKTGVRLKEGALTKQEENLKNQLIKKYRSEQWNIETKYKTD